MKDTENESFSRVLPKVVQFAEKPMGLLKSLGTSGKIKKIYDGYGAFCEEIGRLLGDPKQKPQISSVQKPPILEEFEFLWQPFSNPEENARQLLTLLSGFYKAGFLVSRTSIDCKINSYFSEENYVFPVEVLKTLAAPFQNEGDLKPRCAKIDDPNTLAFYFWLCPEESLGLLLVSDTPEPERREMVLKTQALIQRHFYC